MLSSSTPSQSSDNFRKKFLDHLVESNHEFNMNLSELVTHEKFNATNIEFHPRDCNLFVDLLKLIKQDLICSRCKNRGLRSDGFSGTTFRFICTSLKCKSTQSGSDFVKLLPKNIIHKLLECYSVDSVGLAGKWAKLLPNKEILKCYVNKQTNQSNSIEHSSNEEFYVESEGYSNDIMEFKANSNSKKLKQDNNELQELVESYTTNELKNKNEPKASSILSYDCGNSVNDTFDFK